jgi:hypothetical protein
MAAAAAYWLWQMIAGPQECTAESRNTLQQTDILLRVLDYVGPGHWCFVAEVSSLWEDVYFNVATREMQVINAKTTTCAPRLTKLSAVFASPARVRHAHAQGCLHLATAPYQRAAGMYADVATLEAAHELGMPYTRSTMIASVRSNRLTVVQFLQSQGCPLDDSMFRTAATRGDIALCAYLHAEQCPWDEGACSAAARRADGSTLRWLREHRCPWYADGIYLSAAVGGIDAMVYLQQQGIVFTAGMLKQMLQIAGGFKNLTAAKWLRQQGAEWPAVLCSYSYQWSGAVLERAEAEGCTSPVR